MKVRNILLAAGLVYGVAFGSFRVLSNYLFSMPNGGMARVQHFSPTFKHYQFVADPTSGNCRLVAKDYLKTETETKVYEDSNCDGTVERYYIQGKTFVKTLENDSTFADVDGEYESLLLEYGLYDRANSQLREKYGKSLDDTFRERASQDY